MKGRKPVPAEVRRRNGNPRKTAIGDPVLIGKRLTVDDDFYDAAAEVDEIEPAEIGQEIQKAPPSWMPPLPETLALTDELDDDDKAQRLWTGLCTLLIDANLITEGDLFGLEALIMAKLEMDRLYFELRTNGSTQQSQNARGGRNSMIANPAFGQWVKASDQVRKWAEHYGMTPVARARLGLALGYGRKLAMELDDGLPDNPVKRDGDIDSTAEEA